MAEKKVYLHHYDHNIKTLQDFMERERIKFISLNDLFEANRDFIFSQMTVADKTAYKESKGKYPESGADLSSDMVLPCPCKLQVDPHGITAEIAISQTNFQEDTDNLYAFENKKIQEIINEDTSQFVDRSTPGVQVYGWCKALWYGYKREVEGKGWEIFNKTEDGWCDFSELIISANIGVNANGGNFSIRLPYVEQTAGMLAVSGGDATAIDRYNAISEIRRFERKELSSEVDLFSSLISYNDLIFISFKKKEKDGEINLFDLPKEISQQEFDMIGLVDEVKVTKSFEGTASYVDITGRDLMKLLIEDGSFFFNPSVCAKPSDLFFNVDETFLQGDVADVSKLNYDTRYVSNESGDYEKFAIKRLRGAANELDIFRSPLNNRIDYIIKGVISQLANIAVVPSQVFTLWPEKTTWTELKPKEE